MKRKLLFIALILLPTILFIGRSSWVILDEKSTTSDTKYYPFDIDYYQELTYSGYEQSITIHDDNKNDVTSECNIVYYDENNIELTSNPVNAGEYYANVSSNNELIARVMLTIKPYPITITVNHNTITYGDVANNNGLADYTLCNPLDSLGQLNYSYTYKQYDDAKVYNDSIIAEFAGNPNYQITYDYGDLTVNTKEIDFTWDNNSLTHVYDGKQYYPTASINESKLVNNDQVSIAVAAGEINVGEYTATASLKNDTDIDKARNYTLVSNGDNTIEKKYEIVQRPIAIKWDIEELVFNGKSKSPNVSFVDIENEGKSIEEVTGDSITPVLEYQKEGSTTWVSNAPILTGKYNVRVKGIQNSDGSINDNFTIDETAIVNNSFEIKPKKIKLNWIMGENYNSSINAYIYNGLSQYPTPSTDDFVEGYEADFEYVIPTDLDGDKSTNASHYEISIKLIGDNSNYYELADNVFEYEITPASLIITANNNTIIYGEEADNDGVSYDGFVNNEKEDVLNGSISYTYGYTLYDAAGTYTAVIRPGGLTSSNYNISYISGDLKVSKRKVSVTWGNTSLVYSGDEQAPSYTLENVVNNDQFSLSTTGKQVDVGKEYQYRIITIIQNENDSSGNYVLEDSNTTTKYEITKANPTVNTAPVFSNIYEGQQTSITKAAIMHGVKQEVLDGSFEFNTTALTYTGTASVSEFTIPVKFKPSNSNYAEYEFNGTVNMMPVAYNGDLYYGNIKSALDSSTSGIIYVIPGTNPTVNSSVEIKTGVTLALPYSGTSTLELTTGENIAKAQPSTYKKSEVTIGDNAIITNNGTLIIGAVISGGGGSKKASGQTAGNYSQITLGNNSKIINNSIIECYGFISVVDDTSSVVNNDGASFKQPFIVYEHRGGTIFTAMAGGVLQALIKPNFEIAPFNRYNMPNCEALLVVNYGAELIGYANLYAGDQQNTTNVSVVGTQDSSLYKLTNEEYSYAELKYSPVTDVTNVKVYGGMDMNSLSLKVTITREIELTTDGLLFPMSWYYDIELVQHPEQTEDAVFNFNQDIKLLPGARLTVHDGCIAIAKDVILYSYFDDVKVGAGTLYEQKGPAELIVDGSLTVENIGGTVLSNFDGAELIVKSGTTMSSKEIITSTPEYKTYTEKLSLYLYQGASITSTPREVAIGTYYSRSRGWYSDSCTIYYNANGGSLAGNASDGPFTTGGSGYTIQNIATSNPIREHYTFEGWYLNAECSEGNEAIGSTIFVNTNLYAKWKPIDYAIKYEDKYYNDFATGESTNDASNPNSFNITSSRYTLKDPANNDYEFGGWYLDAECTNRISAIIGSELINSLSNNAITLYALWYPAGSSKYVVNYSNTNPDVTCQASDTIVLVGENKLSDYKLPDISDDNTNKEYDKYFDGWYYEDKLITVLTEDLFANGTPTLTAKWIDKYEVKLTHSLGEIIYYAYNQSITLPTVNSLTGETVDNAAGTITLRTLLWNINGTDYQCGETFTPTSDTVVTAKIIETIYYKLDIKLTNVTAVINVSNGNMIKVDDYSGFTNDTYSAITTIYVSNGSNVKIDFKYSNNTNSLTIKKGSTSIVTTADASASFQVESSTYSIVASSEASSSGGCVAAGTLITLADGTKKKVEELTGDELLLVFNHETGEYDFANIIFIDNDGWKEYEILYLLFSDGTTVKVIYSHGFYDLNLNKYVYIDKNNYSEYIGHSFYSATYNNAEYIDTTITLVDAYIETEYTGCYSPVTVNHLNYFTNDLLSMPAGIEGLFNIFEYDENMKYNESQMTSDIEEYGLYTYDDFKEYLPEEIYNLFPAPYLKVSVGKGYITFEGILELIDRYLSKILK